MDELDSREDLRSIEEDEEEDSESCPAASMLVLVGMEDRLLCFLCLIRLEWFEPESSG